jgi:hypothetical protein
MNERIRGLLNQITALEDDLCTTLHRQETEMFIEIRRVALLFLWAFAGTSFLL